MSRVGGIANVCSGPPRAAVGLAERGTDGHDDVGAAHRVVGDARAPDAGHPARERMVFRQRALGHQRRRDRHRHQLGERLQFVRRFREQDAVAGEDRRRLRRLQQLHGVGDAIRRAGGAAIVGPAARHLLRRRIEVLREDVHRNVEQHRARIARSARRSARAASRRSGTWHRPRARRACRSGGRCRPATHRRGAGCPDAARARGDTTACCR